MPLKRFWRKYFGRLPDPEPVPLDTVPLDVRRAFHDLSNKHMKLAGVVHRLSKRQDALDDLMNSLKEQQHATPDNQQNLSKPV